MTNKFKKTTSLPKSSITYGFYCLLVAYILAVILPTVFGQLQCDLRCVSGCNKSLECNGDCEPGAGPNITSTGMRICTNCSENCQAGCNKNGGGSCDGCTSAYGLTNHIPPVCAPCALNCSGGCAVAGAGKCDRCSTGYGIINSTGASNGTCGLCDPNCVADSGCTRTGAGKCDGECAPGFGFSNGSSICERCDVNCKSLCSIQGAGKCDSVCKAGWGLDNSTYTCKACAAHCEKGCKSNGIGKCDECDPGYGLFANLTCGICGSNCVSCATAGAGNCNQCVQGYALGPPDNKTCGRCDPACRGGCDVTGVNKCDVECNFGYVKVANSTCLGCQNSTICLAGCNKTGPGLCDGNCSPGFGYNDTTHLCGACDPNCNTTSTAGGCSVAGKCDVGRCNHGYGSTSDSTCANCSANCANCTFSGGRCDVCQPWYTLTINKTCAQCQNSTYCLGGCYKSGDGKCDGNCTFGYGINNSTWKCESCDPNCLTGCAIAGSGKCDGNCTIGYGINNSTWKCESCDPNCQTGCATAGSGKCDKGGCKEGFVSTDNLTCVYPQSTAAPPREGTSSNRGTAIAVSGGNPMLDITATGGGGVSGESTVTHEPGSNNNKTTQGSGENNGASTSSGGPNSGSTSSGGPHGGSIPSGGPNDSSTSSGGPHGGSIPSGGPNDSSTSSGGPNVGSNGMNTTDVTTEPTKKSKLVGPLLLGIFGFLGILLSMLLLWCCLPSCAQSGTAVQGAPPATQSFFYVQQPQPQPQTNYVIPDEPRRPQFRFPLYGRSQPY